MSQVVIMKDRTTGKLGGVGEKGARAYAKWKRTVEAMQPGDTARFSYRLPRSPKHHGLFFVKLSRLLDNTETFDDLDKLRYWLVMGAGYFDMIPGMDGVPCAIPRSIDFESMDEQDFGELHKAVDDFLWTTRAQETLWPHASAEQRHAFVDGYLREFA